MTDILFDNSFTQCHKQEGFSAHIGPFFEKNIDGIMHRALKIEAHHLNPEGVVHGGVTLTLADYIIYRAIGDEIGHDIRFATINLNSNLVAAAKEGDILFGVGNVVRKTKSIIFAEGRIFTNKNKILHASGVWKIIGVN
jgi:uncharacterized protein (TIGR00369 family)